MPHDIQPYWKFAIETAYLAGKETLGYYQRPVNVDIKNDGTPVTEADRKAEELIRRMIEQRFPGHAIIGEEYGMEENTSASHRWYIDPIDGTKFFMRGIPFYSVLLSLEIDGSVEAGVAYFPAIDGMLTAATGLGCWWNGRPTRVSNTGQLRNSMMVVPDTASFINNGKREALERILELPASRIGWYDAYGYMLLATGRVDLVIEPVVNIWDVALYPPILKEAGGFFGDWTGNPTIQNKQVLASNPALVSPILKVLEGTL